MDYQKQVEDLKNVLYVDRIYLALELLKKRRNNISSQVDLSLSELRLFSQNGEDGVIDAIVMAIHDMPKYFVEYGVGDGWSCNCRVLAEIFGWEGLFIEIDKNDYKELSERYRYSNKVTCLNEAVSSNNINDLFSENQVPERFGVLSVDIDGQDYWTWRALDSEYKPDLVVIEYNSALDPNIVSVEKEGIVGEYPLGRDWGASLQAMKELGNDKGYDLVHIEMAGANLFFVRRELIKKYELLFNGIVEGRSPNYGLRGRNHTKEVLYGSGEKVERPQALFDKD